VKPVKIVKQVCKGELKNKVVENNLGVEDAMVGMVGQDLVVLSDSVFCSSLFFALTPRFPGTLQWLAPLKNSEKGISIMVIN